VVKVTDSIRTIFDALAETMYLAKGVGLAAVQVGINQQLAVVDVGSGLIKLVNPVIVEKEGCETAEEGCLSIPDVFVEVKRARKVVVNCLDEKGDNIQISAEGLLARALQHEIDHLSGRLIIDYLSPFRRFLLRKGIKKPAKQKTQL
jgi:peptide deformylase